MKSLLSYFEMLITILIEDIVFSGEREFLYNWFKIFFKGEKWA